MLRHGRIYPDKTSWTKSHATWIAAQRFEHMGERIALSEYQLAVQSAEERVNRLTDALQEADNGWRFEPVVAGCTPFAASTLSARLDWWRRSATSAVSPPRAS